MLPVHWSGSWTAALVNHLWQSTTVAGVAWFLAWTLKKNHARARYWLWMIASVKFLLPLGLLMLAGEGLRRLGAEPVVTGPAMVSAMEQAAQPFSPMPFSGAVTLSSGELPHGNGLAVLLVAVWMCGALLIVLRWARGWRRMQAAVRLAIPFAIAADVPVLRSKARIEPGIVGIFRPVLLLPDGIVERITPAQLRAIVAHEMCHVRRRDNLTFAVHMLVESLFWFHPAVWWIGARLVEERERACDEAVLGAGGDAQTYAEGILNVCRYCVESPLGCVAGVTGADLKKRIARIVAAQTGLRLNVRKKLLLGVIGSIAMAAPVVFGLNESVKPAPDWQEAAGGKMEFDAATVKPSRPDAHPSANFALNIDNDTLPPGGLLSAADMPLSVYVEFAYKVMLTHEQEAEMLAHLPGWVATQRFDFTARASGTPTKDQARLMMQAMLADRFKLVLHFETRDTAVLAMILDKPGKLGPRIRSHAEGPPCDKQLPVASDPGSASLPPGAFVPVCHAVVMHAGDKRTLLLGARDVDMEHIASYLPTLESAGRPVVDRTGVAGTFDFSINWLPPSQGSGSSAAESAPGESGPTFEEAMREQLGLKFRSERDPVRTLVIDRVELPSPN